MGRYRSRLFVPSRREGPWWLALEEDRINDDAESVASRAHLLKGTAANLSANAVRDIAATLESMGKRRDLEGANEQLESLQNEIQKLSHDIRVIVGNGNAPRDHALKTDSRKSS